MRLIPLFILVCITNLSNAQEIIHSAIVPWQPNRLTSSGGSLYFVSSDDNLSNSLWQTDGTLSGTFQVESNFEISDVRSLIDYKDNLIFMGYSDSHGLELWKKPGSTQEPIPIKDLNPGPNGIISNNENHYIESISTGVIFTTSFNGPQVWITDGTEAGTLLLLDDCEASHFYAWKDELYFFQTNSNQGLYKTNGTPGNKTLIKGDIAPVYIDNFYQAMSGTENHLFFIYEYYVNGVSLNMELWKSDGTSIGTQKIINLEEKQFGRTQRRFWTNSTHLFFVGYQEDTGAEPWISDGTISGTKILSDISTGDRSSSPRYFTECLGTVYFVANKQLYKSDGTDEGTIKALNGSQNIDRLTSNGLILHHENDDRVWQYNPENQINKKISTINNFISFDDPVYLNNFLLFSDEGNLYVFDLSELVNTIEKKPTGFSDLKIFPNPFKESFTIDLVENEMIPLSSIEISNISGEVLKKVENPVLPKMLGDLKGLHAGLYIIRLTGKNFVKSQLIFKSN